MGIEAPRELGGLGLSFTASLVAIEEIAKADPSVSALCDIHNTLTQTILRQYGSEYLKDQYIPRLSKNCISSFCLSESESGSDAFALKTSAKELPDGSFVLSGSKMWISNSAEAELFLVFANAAPEKGYKGISCFLVERGWGVQVGKKEAKLGLRASSTCQLTFDAVKIPKENVVGTIGHGYKYAIGILNEGRIGIAAQMVGLAQGVFDKTLSFVYGGKEPKKGLSQNPVFQIQSAQIATEIEAARLLTYNAARLKEQKHSVIKEASMAKLLASQVAEKAASLCIDWMGREGLSNDSLVQKFYRDSKIGSIYEGTSNIQLQTIAKQIISEIDSQ